MKNLRRIQHIGFRTADVLCSAAAFGLAFAGLATIQNTLTHNLPGLLKTINIFIPGAATGVLPMWTALVWIGVVVTLAMSITLEYLHDGKPITLRSPWRVVLLMAVAMTVAACVLSTILYTFHVPLYSRLFVFSDLAYLFVLTVSYRLLFRAALVRRERGGKASLRVAIAGGQEGVERYLAQAQPGFRPHIEIAGCLLADGTPSASVLGVPVLGQVSALGDLLIHQPIDEVVIVLPAGPAPWLGEVLEHCDYFRISVHIICEAMLSVSLRDLTTANILQNLPAITLVPEEDFLSDRLVWKRLIDVVVSAAALVVLLPVMLFIAIGIKITTPGLPVFYTWGVVGYRGRRFNGYKFTTMVADADQRKEHLQHLNEMNGPVFKIRNDPRMTSFGKFLRKYSLNELPQFWSVLVGDMSLVGPRPAGPHELKKYELWHKRKLSIQPGITCFWQVRGRNAITSFDDWVKMDLEYIQKRSMRTDMSILLQTVKVVLGGSGS